MPYSTKSDLEAEIPRRDLNELTEDSESGQTADEIIAAAIEGADGIIDSYIGPRYDVPLSAPIPRTINDLSRDIAIYKIRTRKPGDPGEIKTKYEDAIKLLKDISAGKADLGIDPQPDGGVEDIKSTKTYDDRTFTMGRNSDGSTGSLDGYL